MVNRSKDKGTLAERFTVGYLSENGFGGAERRTQSGRYDKGDVSGTPGLVWEVKDQATLCLPAWLHETQVERENANADFGILVIKPPGYGVTRVGKWWAAMHAGQWSKLLAAITSNRGHMPLSHPEELSGARLGDLSNVIRRLPEPSYVERISLPHVMINPRGVKDPTRFYNITRLDQMVAMVRMAGYGDPYIIE